MPRHDDNEGPDEAIDADLFDDERDTVRCPLCAGEIYEDSEQCPECGQWLTSRPRRGAGESDGGRKLITIIIVIALVLSMLLLW